jgi:cell pole-organizing protein PopZ
MTAFDRRISLGAAALALLMAGSAAAQENLDSGKTPAELYASDCAICHKSPRGLAQTGGILGVQAFLREHYTASREAAAAIAAYLEQADKGAGAPAHPVKRTAKPKDKSKTEDAKPADKETEPKATEAAKPGEVPAAASTKPDKPEQSDKPVEAKADDAKPSARKPRAVAKPDSTKPDADKKSD